MSKIYQPPTLTVDAVVFQIINGVLAVLLIRRSNDPFRNHLALPGGYNAAGETTEHALGRVLAKKAGLLTADLKYVEQLYTFDTVARDPRGHAVSVTYVGLGNNLMLNNSSTVEQPEFYPVGGLSKVAFDHKEIIVYAHDRLKSKLVYTNAIYGLLPEKFTMTQLQTAYEAILGHSLDKRNFRKKFLSLDLIDPTGDKFQDGAHRPAELYGFKSQKLQILSRSFD